MQGTMPGVRRRGRLCMAWMDNNKSVQDFPWKSQSEWQRKEINWENMSMVWPTRRSRTAKEQNRTVCKLCVHIWNSSLWKIQRQMVLTVCGSPEIHCQQVLSQDHYHSFSPSHPLNMAHVIHSSWPQNQSEAYNADNSCMLWHISQTSYNWSKIQNKVILLYHDLNYAIVSGPMHVTWRAKINNVAQLCQGSVMFPGNMA